MYFLLLARLVSGCITEEITRTSSPPPNYIVVGSSNTNMSGSTITDYTCSRNPLQYGLIKDNNKFGLQIYSQQIDPTKFYPIAER